MLGRNRTVEREAWPEDGPSIGLIRRLHYERLGKPRPGKDDPIDDVEYAELLAVVKGGTRKAMDGGG